MKYDPRVAYFERMNSFQRAGFNRVKNHKFSSDLGGCDANYRI